MIIHLIKSIDIGGEDCWLIEDKDKSKIVKSKMRKIEIFGRRRDSFVNAWRIDGYPFDRIKSIFRDDILCNDCISGNICPKWNKRSLEEEGYQIHPDMLIYQHTRVLNLSWPCTQDQIRESFKMMIIQNHPDHGGQAELTHKLVQARNYLLSKTNERF